MTLRDVVELPVLVHAGADMRGSLVEALRHGQRRDHNLARSGSRHAQRVFLARDITTGWSLRRAAASRTDESGPRGGVPAVLGLVHRGAQGRRSRFWRGLKTRDVPPVLVVDQQKAAFEGDAARAQNLLERLRVTIRCAAFGYRLCLALGIAGHVFASP